MLKKLEQLNTSLERITFRRPQQIGFLEDLMSLMSDGMPAQQALMVIQQTARGGIAKAAEAILDKIAQGQQLASGLEGWFNSTTIEVIRAGEEGGTLAKSIATAIQLLKQQSSTTSGIWNSVLYPCIVVALGLGVSVFLKHTIFNEFAKIKPVALWPSNGRFIYYAATIIEHFWWLIILTILAITISIAYLFRYLIGPLRVILDKFPPFSVYRKITAARFMATLGTLVSNSVTFKNALIIIRRHNSHYVRWHIHKMQIKLSSGRENIAEVLDTRLLDKTDIVRLRIIAQGKHFEPALIRLGDSASQRNIKFISNFAKVLGGILLISGAIWAIFMIFAVYGVGTFIAT